MSKLLLTLAIAIMGASCGAAGSGSCAIAGTSGSAGYCIGYPGSGYTSSSVQAACTAAKGTYGSGACAAGSGTCTFSKGTASEYNYVYASADAGNGLSSQGLCTAAGGTFTTP